MKRSLIFTCLIAIFLLLLPGAAAHASYLSDDGAYRISIGYQGEPVYTFQTTGLDLIIRENATGGPVEGVHETLQATLISPGGEELSHDLEPQHGETNRYEFTKGFVLTQPGLYKLRLVGTINDTEIDDTYDMAHATEPRTETMFPAKGLDDIEALNERIADLEAQVAALEQNGGANTNGDQADQNGEAPLTIFPMVLLGIALLALMRRR